MCTKSQIYVSPEFSGAQYIQLDHIRTQSSPRVQRHEIANVIHTPIKSQRSLRMAEFAGRSTLTLMRYNGNSMVMRDAAYAGTLKIKHDRLLVTMAWQLLYITNINDD